MPLSLEGLYFARNIPHFSERLIGTEMTLHVAILSGINLIFPFSLNSLSEYFKEEDNLISLSS